MTNQPKQPANISLIRKPIRLASIALLATVLISSSPVFAVNKDMVQLQTQVQQLQDAVARLQQSNDERMGVMKDLIQQSADSVNRMSVTLETLQKQVAAQQEGQNGKIDQVSGQIQSLNDSIDEIKARMGTLQKLMQDIQGQQQSMSANMQNQPQSGGLSSSAPVTSVPDGPSTPAPIVRRGKPSADVPMPPAPTTPAPGGAGAPPADELYKTALGDYMAAKYALADAEFGDVVKNYPDNPLAGNSYYYQAEIDYRGGRYAAAIKAYDSVLQQYPDSNKVPVAHLHKGMALVALNQKDAAVREFRTLIQRFPNSPEAMQARSKLSGMGVTVAPKQHDTASPPQAL
jgi:tol-pal system protein YbgF